MGWVGGFGRSKFANWVRRVDVERSNGWTILFIIILIIVIIIIISWEELKENKICIYTF